MNILLEKFLSVGTVHGNKKLFGARMFEGEDDKFDCSDVFCLEL